MSEWASKWAKEHSEPKSEKRSRQMSARWLKWLLNWRVEYWAICSSARSIAQSPSSLTQSLSPHCLQSSRPLIRLIICSFTRSLTRPRAHGKDIYVNELNVSVSNSINQQQDQGKKCVGKVRREASDLWRTGSQPNSTHSVKTAFVPD